MSAAPVPEERRVVCVVFAQATGLSEDPPAANELFTKLRTVVERHGGAVDKFIGDVVMAVFGAPVAHADDPARAVRAALGLMAETRAFAAARGAAIDMRAGVNRGEVLYGSVGGDRPTVMGDPVNVARRLQEEAAPGEILAAGEVVRAAGAAFEFGEPETLRLRGRDRPIDVHRVEREREGGTVVREAGKGLPMVGRAEELERLLEAVRSGRGAFFVVEGEAGSGKTRLLAEFRRRARERHPRAWVTAGRALEGAHLPLGAFAEALRSGAPAGAGLRAWVAESLGEPAGSLAPHLVLSSIGEELPDDRARDLPADVRQAETARAWARLLAGRASEAPAIVCLEDLQWADAATTALMEALAAALAGAPVMLLATSRPGGPSPAGFQHLPLPALGREDALSLAERALRRPASPELARFLFQQAGGNPFYVLELARWLDEQKLLSGDPAALAAPPTRLPEGLHGLLVARLDGLPRDEKETLKSASAAGGAVWAEMLAAATGRDVRADLEACRRRGLLVLRGTSLLPGDEEYAWSHALLREAAYALLPKKDRARLHVAIAGRLEDLVPRGGRRVRALAASQRESAGDRAAAADLWLVSAREALGEAAGLECYEYAREARRLVPTVETRILAARALTGLARHAEALEEALAAVATADLSPEQATRARVVLSIVHERRSDYPGACAAAEEALALAPGPGLRAEAAWCVGSAYFRLARFAEAHERFEEARACFAQPRAPGDPPPERDFPSRLENGLGLVRMTQGNYDEAEQHLLNSLRFVRESGSRRGVMVALSNLGIVRNRRGDFAGALRFYEEALPLAVLAGDSQQQAVILNNIGGSRYQLGDLDGAGTAWTEAHRLRLAVGDTAGAASTAMNLGLILRRRGDREGALRLFEEAEAVLRRLGSLNLLAEALSGRGNVLLDLGRKEEALRDVDEALEIQRRIGNRSGIGHALAGKATFHQGQGELAEARAAAEKALALVREMGERGSIAIRTYELAAICLDCGDDGAADRLFEELAAALPEAREGPSAVSASVCLAGWLAGRGRDAEALALLDRIVVLCESRGMLDMVSEARHDRALIWAAQGRPEAAAEARASLQAARDARWSVQEAFSAATLAAIEPTEENARLVAETASALHDSLGPLVTANLLCRQARAWDRLGDGPRARRALEEGLRLARAHGLTGALRRLERLAAGFESPLEPPPRFR